MKQNINIPESINDITLSQWQKIVAIDENIEPIVYTHKVLHIVYGIKNISIYKKKDLDLFMDVVTNMLNSKPTFQNRFTLDGVEYGFIPDLDDISFGEFVDLEKYTKPEDYHKLMSILFRPITNTQGGRYTIDDYRGSNDKLKDMPLGVVLGATGFFLTLGEQLLNDTRKSLTAEELAQAKKLDLVKSGDGTLQFFSSQTTTS